MKNAKVARPLTEKGRNVNIARRTRSSRTFPAWGEIKDRILDAMYRCKKEIEDKAQAARCISRVNKVGTVVQKYQRTLSPYDFYLRMEDVCPIPDIRKVIVNGTDEEFNTRAKEVTPELPKLTSRILEERTAKISALLPFNDRPGGVLSLATAWFSCGLCCRYPTHGTDALIPHCLSLADHPSKQPTGEEAFDSHVQGRGWCADTSMFKFSETASTIARGLVLDCGEDPESITLAEIYSKFHRFVFYEKGELVAHNWQETVKPYWFFRGTLLWVNYPQRPVQFNYKYRNPSAYHRFLGPDECPEFVHDPSGHDRAWLWCCFHCWRYCEDQAPQVPTLPSVKQHIANK